MAREKTGKITRTIRITPKFNDDAKAYALKHGFADFSEFTQHALEQAMKNNAEPGK